MPFDSVLHYYHPLSSNLPPVLSLVLPMASSTSPALSAAPSAALATAKTPADRRRAKADERLAAIMETLDNVKGEATALKFVGAMKSVWVRGSVASAASLPRFH